MRWLLHYGPVVRRASAWSSRTRGPGFVLPGTWMTVAAWAGTVSPLEPADWLLLARGRRLIGSAARKVLGPRAPAVRAYLFRAGVQARKVFSQLQQRGRGRG